MSENQVFTVSQINQYVKHIMDHDILLQNIWIRGEISNFKAHYSGHLYFTLKDETSQMKAVMFRSAASRLVFTPETGMKVLARCRVSVYEAGGVYQAYVEELKTDGIGDLHVAFEQLKAKLMEQGLFDADRKKRLPRFPEKIGIVTSATGAAIRDMLNILGRRYPLARIYLYPSLVQGEEAPAQIIDGIRYFNQSRFVDFIIIGRGGGSMEDLWAFNDEELAREIAASQLPVISAVGHEVDFTIADFVADLRAPTPSAAAELAVPDQEELRQRLGYAKEKLMDALKRMIVEKQMQFQSLSVDTVFSGFQRGLEEKRIFLDQTLEEMHSALKEVISEKKEDLSVCSAKLDALSPLQVLRRGYSIVQKEDGSVVRKREQVQPGETLCLTLHQGKIHAQVIEE